MNITMDENTKEVIMAIVGFPCAAIAIWAWCKYFMGPLVK